VAAVALFAAGCTSSTTGQGADVVSAPASTPVPSSTPVVVPSTPVAVPSSAPATSTSAAPSSSAATAPPSSAVAVPRSTCTKLTIRAIPGGASMGQEIAALQFTNDGTTSCRLVGYPTVTLYRGGAMVGRPSEPAGARMSSRTLAPGDTAESLLHDYVVNCQAPLSDTLRVVAPGSTQRFGRPMQMRACVLRTDPLGAPD
jgi:hypothetical protein